MTESGVRNTWTNVGRFIRIFARTNLGKDPRRGQERRERVRTYASEPGSRKGSFHPTLGKNLVFQLVKIHPIYDSIACLRFEISYLPKVFTYYNALSYSFIYLTFELASFIYLLMLYY